MSFFLFLSFCIPYFKIERSIPNHSGNTDSRIHVNCKEGPTKTGCEKEDILNNPLATGFIFAAKYENTKTCGEKGKTIKKKIHAEDSQDFSCWVKKWKHRSLEIP